MRHRALSLLLACLIAGCQPGSTGVAPVAGAAGPDGQNLPPMAVDQNGDFVGDIALIVPGTATVQDQPIAGATVQAYDVRTGRAVGEPAITSDSGDYELQFPDGRFPAVIMVRVTKGALSLTNLVSLPAVNGFRTLATRRRAPDTSKQDRIAELNYLIATLEGEIIAVQYMAPDPQADANQIIGKFDQYPLASWLFHGTSFQDATWSLMAPLKAQEDALKKQLADGDALEGQYRAKFKQTFGYDRAAMNDHVNEALKAGMIALYSGTMGLSVILATIAALDQVERGRKLLKVIVDFNAKPDVKALREAMNAWDEKGREDTQHALAPVQRQMGEAQLKLLAFQGLLTQAAFLRLDPFKQANWPRLIPANSTLFPPGWQGLLAQLASDGQEIQDRATRRHAFEEQLTKARLELADLLAPTPVPTITPTPTPTPVPSPTGVTSPAPAPVPIQVSRPPGTVPVNLPVPGGAQLPGDTGNLPHPPSATANPSASPAGGRRRTTAFAPPHDVNEATTVATTLTLPKVLEAAVSAGTSAPNLHRLGQLADATQAVTDRVAKELTVTHQNVQIDSLIRSALSDPLSFNASKLANVDWRQTETAGEATTFIRKANQTVVDNVLHGGQPVQVTTPFGVAAPTFAVTSDNQLQVTYNGQTSTVPLPSSLPATSPTQPQSSFPSISGVLSSLPADVGTPTSTVSNQVAIPTATHTSGGGGGGGGAPPGGPGIHISTTDGTNAPAAVITYGP